MRIVLLNDLLPPDSEGGLELSAYETGKGLRGRGHDVQFVCSAWRDKFQGDRSEPDYMHRILDYVETYVPRGAGVGLKVEAFGAIQRKVNVAEANHKKLADWLKQDGPFDVALVFGILGIGLGVARVFTEAGIPIVWSMGDVSVPVHFRMATETKLYKLAFGTVARKWHSLEKQVDFSHVLVTSDFVRRELLAAGIKPERCEVIPRAIDFEIPDNPRKESPPSMLIACRLAPARGVHVAIEAAKILAERRPELDWTLKIAGSGSEVFVDSLKAQAESLGGRVSFLGKLPKPELLEEMKRATIVVNPIIEVEGFGRTNIEALACSAALIATDIPSIHEIVTHGVNAEIVPTGDAEKLSSAMERLLSDEQYRDSLISKGLSRIREAYTMPPVLDRIEANLKEDKPRV